MDGRVWRWVRIYFRLLALIFLEDIYTVKHHSFFHVESKFQPDVFILWLGEAPKHVF